MSYLKIPTKNTYIYIGCESQSDWHDSCRENKQILNEIRKRLLNFDVPPTDGITILSIPLAPSIKRQRKFNKRLHKSNKHSDPLCTEEYYKHKILQQIWTSVIVICIGCGLFFSWKLTNNKWRLRMWRKRCSAKDVCDMAGLFRSVRRCSFVFCLFGKRILLMVMYFLLLLFVVLRLLLLSSL